MVEAEDLAVEDLSRSQRSTITESETEIVAELAPPAETPVSPEDIKAVSEPPARKCAVTAGSEEAPPIDDPLPR